MEEIKEHMTAEHEESRKESYVEAGVIAGESCCICQKVFLKGKTWRNIYNWKFSAQYVRSVQQWEGQSLTIVLLWNILAAFLKKTLVQLGNQVIRAQFL